MPVEFTLPDVGEGVAEGEILQWLVSPGDPVSEDQPVVEVETDKAVVEVPSPVDGTVKELRADAGDVVPVGDVIIVFDVPDEEDESDAAADVDAAGGPESGTATAPDNGDGGDAAVPGVDAESDDGPGENGDEGQIRVFAAPSARRLARERDVDLATVEGSGPGGRITESDVREAAEREDDASAEKQTTDGDADDATAIAVEPTDDVSASEDGTVANEDESDRERTIAEAEEPLGGAQPTVASGTQPTTEDAGQRTDPRERTLAAPATRQLAEEHDVDIDQVPASEEHDGEPFVTEDDVRAYVESGGTARDTATGSAATGGLPSPSDAELPVEQPSSGETERIPYRGVRRTIGEQMERSKFTAPHVTHHDSVDVSNLVDARASMRERAERQGVTLTYLPFVIKAVTAALAEYPVLNAELDEDAGEIVMHGEYNVGVATATDAGLMVPVVEHADRKSLLEIAREANDLVAKARDRSIAREEMQGGTFTITNFGAIGGDYATPILNYPETAILGLGAIKERPWVDDGDVVARDVMTLSLSIDHRVVDGAEAARFTNTLKEYLRNPAMLLLDGD